MVIKRRLGSTSGKSPGGQNCSEVFLTLSGEVAVIGTEVSREVKDRLLDGTELPEGMNLVVISREALTKAALAIPETQ